MLSLVEFTALAFRGALLIWCNWKVSIWEQHFWLPECQWKRDLVMSWCWMAQTHWLGESAVTQRSEEGWLFSPRADFHYDVWKVRVMLERVLSLLQRGMLERHEQRHEWDDFYHLCSFDPDLWWMESGLDCRNQNMSLHSSRWTRRGRHLLDPMAGVLWPPKRSQKSSKIHRLKMT